jgi:hypothetical protein
MKRIVIRRNESQESLNRRIQEMKQSMSNLKAAREGRHGKGRPLREMKISEFDLEALREVQGQFDSLIEQMTDAKLLLAGFAVGFDEMSVDRSPSSE